MTALRRIETSVILETQVCGSCGGVWGLNEAFKELKAEDGGFWYCPYCKQGRGYPNGRLQRESEQAKLDRALADANKLRAERDAALQKASDASALYQRTKDRVANGVCPCCNRTLKQLAAHMKRMHPEYSQ